MRHKTRSIENENDIMAESIIKNSRIKIAAFFYLSKWKIATKNDIFNLYGSRDFGISRKSKSLNKSFYTALTPITDIFALCQISHA
jgi:hypothetical protein